MTDDTLQLAKLIQAHQIVIASAESCTGGKIADFITDVSGVSENFWGSWVVYDNTAKIELGVPSEIISQHGAVSSQTAVSMAESGLKKLSSVLSRPAAQMLGVTSTRKKLAVVSTTGVAGPTGGTATHPVGLCFVGVAISTQGAAPTTRFLKIEAPTGLSRTENKSYFTQRAIEFLLQCLSE
ncbi:MAG: CinA family protein [Bdellovibrionia bacterium]